MRYLIVLVLAACAQPASMGMNPDGNTSHPDGAGMNSDGAMPPSISHAVTIIVEPNGNSGAELISAITAAKTSVYMTMYELDNSKVISALTGRKQAGLDVQAI